VLEEAGSPLSRGELQQRSGSEFKFGAKKRTSSAVVGEGDEGQTPQRGAKAKLVQKARKGGPGKSPEQQKGATGLALKK
jgi:hypothetical protein